MWNPLDEFTNCLFQYLTASENVYSGGIIKRHTDRLSEHGEFSFPLKIEPWKPYIKHQAIKENKAETIFDVLTSRNDSKDAEDACQCLMKESSKWKLNIDKCLVLKNRIHVFLNKSLTIKACFECSSHNRNPQSKTTKNIMIKLQDGDESDLTYFRLCLIRRIADNLLKYYGYDVNCDNFKENQEIQEIYFTTKSSELKESKALNVLCSSVLNCETGLKETATTSNDYLLKRSTDMMLIAQHKYGVRKTNDSKWEAFAQSLGKAAVTFDLLEIKPSHPTLISLYGNGAHSSKGAPFVLYNCARINAMILKYDEHVKTGSYPELPAIQDIDFNLLNDKDEWILVFHFLLRFDSVMQKSLVIDGDSCSVSPHHLCIFLSSLVGRFSIYYRRIRVLLEPREHLLPLIFARMHLLKALQSVIHSGLKILNLEPVNAM